MIGKEQPAVMKQRNKTAASQREQPDPEQCEREISHTELKKSYPG